MLKNMAEPGRPRMTIWRMRIVCWVPKATNTHTVYVTRIAFPLQQWFTNAPVPDLLQLFVPLSLSYNGFGSLNYSESALNTKL